MTFPEDFINRMKAMLGDEYSDFEKSFSEEIPSRGIRINTLKDGAKEKVLGKTEEYEQVSWCENGYRASGEMPGGRHPYHASGLFYFQEPSAMSAVPQLGIKPGMRVLDLCAAPGGKATQGAAYLKGEGLIVANEIIAKRAAILSENIERLGVKNAVVTNETPQRLSEKYPEFFDRIILDAPCSGEGMFRKEPQAVTEWSLAHVEACSVRQKHIADCAVKMLSPGGRLVYSTCTFAPSENEGVAEYIINTYPDMKLVKIEAEGLSDGNGKWIESGEDMSKTARIFPHKAKGEGHFIALFEKSGEGIAEAMTAKEIKSKEYDEFCKKFLINPPKGVLISFGDTLYLLPYGINIDKIKVVRAGLELGEVRKGRFIPSHALALALKKEDFKNTIDFDSESEEIKKFLRGETIDADIDGWCCVLSDGYPIGWTKGSGGVLKNHYPKYLRNM